MERCRRQTVTRGVKVRRALGCIEQLMFCNLSRVLDLCRLRADLRKLQILIF
jgi:hypothetical protein